MQSLPKARHHSTRPSWSNHKACKWIFPSAHERWSSVFQEDMTKWFDIRSLSYPDEKQDLQVDGLKESIDYVNSIIDRALQTVPASNIILGGISQGFAVAISTLLTRQETFGGFVGMSGWIPLQKQLRETVQEEDKSAALTAIYALELGIITSTTENTHSTPIWMSHSTDDNTVDLQLGISACETLQSLGFSVDFHEYQDGEHWLQEPKGHDDLVVFLTSKL